MENIGFQNSTFKSPPALINGPLEQMISRRMNADFAQQNQTSSFTFYRRVELGSVVTRQVFFQIPDDYYYHLDAFRVFYPLTAGADESPAVDFQYYQVARDRELCTSLPFRLVTTPGFQQRARYRVKMNHTFLPSDKIRIDIRPRGTDPEYLDIISLGFLIPKDYIMQE